MEGDKMTLILVNTKDQSIDFQVSYPAWNTALYMAQQNGWIPEGVDPPIWVDPETREPLIKEFPPMSYNSNDGQEVRETDAIKLSEALDRGLKFIPIIETNSVESSENIEFNDNADPQEVQNELFDGFCSVLTTPLNPITYFSGAEGISFLKELIDFLQRGQFYIL